MQDSKRMEKLYDAVIDHTLLTTKELNEYGFNSYNLNNLLEVKFLERVKRGVYRLKDTEGMLYYGKKLIAQEQYAKSEECFEKILQLNPTNSSAAFQIFLRSIKSRNYDRALQMYDIMELSGKTAYEQDNNYWLYLLSKIIKLEGKYKEKVEKLNIKDIMVPESDKRYPNKKEENEIRLLAFKGMFSQAFKQLNNIKEPKTVQTITSYALLHQRYALQKDDGMKIKNLIEKRKYQELEKFLLEESILDNEHSIKKYLLPLTKEITRLIDTSTLPPENNKKYHTMLEAINNHNYDLAMQFSIKINKQKNFDYNKDYIYILLKEIKILKENIKKDQGNTIKAEIRSFYYQTKEELAKSGKSEYEWLILSLMKIGVLKKDYEFKAAKKELSLIKDKNYQIDLSRYINYLSSAINQNKIKEAKVWVDIVAKLNAISQGQKISYQKNNISKVINTKQRLSPGIKEPRIVTKEKLPILPKNLTSIQVKYLKTYQKLLFEKGVVVSKITDEKEMEEIKELLEKYNNLNIFTIEDNNHQQHLVLQYKTTNITPDRPGKLRELINIHYRESEHQTVIELGKRLLSIVNKATISDYGLIGLSYLQLNDKKHANDYLMIADYLSRENNLESEDRNYIKMSEEHTKTYIYEKKPYVNMTIEEFQAEAYNNYGIKDFDEIHDFISNSNLDVTTACEQLGLSKIKTNIIKLVYARYFYANKNFKKGNEFLKSVENSKDKNDKIYLIYNELINTRRFYQYRDTPKLKQLSHSLKPEK